MRTKYKPWALPYIEEHANETISLEEIATLEYPVYLEIGSGKGQFLCDMATKFSDLSFIGVEKNVTCAGYTLKKIVEQEIPNAKLFYGDGLNVIQTLKDKSVKYVFLNFSDPWPKKRQTKRRLTYGTFLQQYNRILKKGGRVIMKTDNVTLFEYSLVSFDENGWHLKEVSVDYRRDPHQEDAITEYEASFMELGQPIYRAMWQVEKEVCHD